MTKEELEGKARNYALAALEKQINEVAAAFISGYKEGYLNRAGKTQTGGAPASKSASSEAAVEETPAPEEREPLPKSLAVGQTIVAKPRPAMQRASGENTVKFFDLGLPSGTLWSAILADENGMYRHFNYEDASKYNLPNGRQFEELFQNCKVLSSMGPYFKIKAHNGTIIPVGKKDEVYQCWMKNDLAITDEKDFKGFSIDQDGMRRAFDMSSKDSYFVMVVKERERIKSRLLTDRQMPNSMSR